MLNNNLTFIRSLRVPLLLVLIIWLVKLYEWLTHTSLAFMGIQPLQWKGLPGIILAPLLHADFSHAFSNTVPILLLGSSLFFFYRSIAHKIFFYSYFFVGLNVWLFSRSGVHIGASGLVYALFGFLLLGGFISRNKALLAVAFLVIFWYGGLIWGILPGKPDISWESHLIGLLFGILLAFVYIPTNSDTLPDDDEDDEQDENDQNEGEMHELPENTDFYYNNSTSDTRFKYRYIPKK